MVGHELIDVVSKDVHAVERVIEHLKHRFVALRFRERITDESDGIVHEHSYELIFRDCRIVPERMEVQRRDKRLLISF